MGAPDHHTAFKVQASFADNEVERQRRLLIEENEKLNRRLRGAENILASKTMERKQFMEGASWTAKKAQNEADGPPTADAVSAEDPSGWAAGCPPNTSS